MTSTSVSPSATPSALALGAPDMLRLIVGASETFAGNYPVEKARAEQAQTLRDLEMHFTTAQKVASGDAARNWRRWRRLSLAAAAGAALALGVAIGSGAGWLAATAHVSATVMPRTEWRVEALVPGAALVQLGGRQWQVRTGDVLPNGDRVLLVDHRAATLVTESGVFKPQRAATAPATAQQRKVP